MHNKTIAELKQIIQKKEISCEELTRLFLQRIDTFNPKLNSFITVTKEQALKTARQHDRNIAKNNGFLTRSLCGIPIAHKDMFYTKDIKTSCGSKMLDNFIAPYNATAVEKLFKSGCISLGKTNMDEFAMGSSNENSYYGAVKNPWNLQYVPGGSSGGSAAAVAARLIPAATASDTGGSIRQPAALSGICGIKPTYGRVSRYGMVALAPSLDHAGIMAKTAEDLALLLNAIAGVDPHDSTCTDIAVPNYCAALNNSLQGLTIGLPQEYFTTNLDAGISLIIDGAISVFKKLGAKVKTISLPHTQAAASTYNIIASAECSANLEQFDGVHYGYRCESTKDLLDIRTRSRSEGFGKEVKRRIMIGTYMLTADHYEAFYLKAQKVRELFKKDFQQAFASVDVILGPTTQAPAFRIGTKANDPVSMYFSDSLTIPANLAGVPAISIPAGFINGLPIGVQLISNYFAEEKILNAAHKFQQETDWHLQCPDEF
jgi:aspartyl-tRNA(Asn)/glutamyl-tRNA(Gln) amidotransferase subunit A